jgi:hypothetical protein
MQLIRLEYPVSALSLRKASTRKGRGFQERNTSGLQAKNKIHQRKDDL